MVGYCRIFWPGQRKRWNQSLRLSGREDHVLRCLAVLEPGRARDQAGGGNKHEAAAAADDATAEESHGSSGGRYDGGEGVYASGKFFRLSRSRSLLLPHARAAPRSAAGFEGGPCGFLVCRPDYRGHDCREGLALTSI